ncbi:MAG: GNAT family N-acetyltransferase [Ilumatobacter sp.]|nr:GNAT family N-acetyltransferase [Ilumatobacter sp.]
MPHPYWPLFDLEVRTPRLTLRVPDDDLERRLLDVASRGVHDPGFMPFTVPWTDLPPPDFERSALEFYWRNRMVRPESWNILFAILVDGEVVGSSNLGAEGFPVTRWFETGSWLGREFHGRGLGKELRIATLHLGFVGFDALIAGTGAFVDNAPSLGVTRSLGYEPNGIAHAARRGELGVIEKFRMTREHFETHVRRDDVELVGLDPVRALLGLS